MPDLLIGVYWNARADGLKICVDRVHAHFQAISKFSPALCHWYERAWRKPKAPKEVDVSSKDILESLVTKGVHQTDIGKQIIEELGWRVGLWNGGQGGLSASISIHCNSTSMRVGNSAILSLSYEEAEPFGHEDSLHLFRQFVEIWEPDEGRVEKSVWNSDIEQHVQTERISFRKSRWPFWISPGTKRFANGLIRMD